MSDENELPTSRPTPRLEFLPSHELKHTMADIEELRADDDVNDSGVEDSSSLQSTSVASSVWNYTYENGRRYHAYRAGSYPLPNDETEQDRMDLLHHIWRTMLGGELLLKKPVTPQRILDVGTGTGLWAIDIADEYPEAIVIGTDLSPIQPGWVPPNCRFYVCPRKMVQRHSY